MFEQLTIVGAGYHRPDLRGPLPRELPRQVTFFRLRSLDFPATSLALRMVRLMVSAFPHADHAVADIIFSEFLTKNATLGQVTITSPINLRVDVFGDANGLIVGNAANGGAEGIAPVPEPNPMALFGIAAVGLMVIMVVRHRKHHWTRGRQPHTTENLAQLRTDAL